MASFVREVLSATGRLGEKEDFGGKASRLKQRLDDLKSTLRSNMETRYVDFSDSFDEVSVNFAQLETVLQEVEGLKTSINCHLKPQLTDAHRDALEISRQLNELNRSVQMANFIKQLYQDTEQANEYLEAKKYLEASLTIQKVQSSMAKIENIKDDQDIQGSVSAIKKEIGTLKQQSCYHLSKDWDANIKISQVENGAQLVIDFNDNQTLCQLVQAMQIHDFLSFRLQKFSTCLINSVIQPLILQKSQILPMQGNSIEFQFHESKGDQSPLAVMDNLEKLFCFMAKQFDFNLKNDESMKTKLGSLVCPIMIQSLLNNCLLPSIPSDMDSLEDFNSTVIGELELFHGILINMKWMSDEDEHAKEMLKLAENINETFINKKCKTLLAEARKLMKKELHVVQLVEEQQTLSQEDATEILKTVTDTDVNNIDVDMEEELLPLPKGMSLSDGLFKFPTCQISVAVLELSSLIQSTINEALQFKDNVHFSGRLLVTARNMFEMYNDILPISHAESLKSLPLNAAIGYNNCMYLAHQCLKIYIPSKELPVPLKQRPLTFADLVPRLRQTATEVFLLQMRKLRDQMRSMLRDSVTGFGQLDGSKLLPSSSEKCLKQVMHQLMHLQSLWKNALPLSIYRRSIGTILNTIVDELVQRVVVLEDIASDAAVQICMHFTLLQDQAPNVFVIEGKKETSKHDILRYVSKWNRFKELIILLNANLREIEDRWASGKGPLANEYSAEEVKHLIRALFQNTDRRAAVLEHIKEAK